MDELEKSLSKALSGNEIETRARNRIDISLEQAIKQISLKEVISKLSIIAEGMHQEKPYLNWHKDADLLKAISHYLNN